MSALAGHYDSGNQDAGRSVADAARNRRFGPL